ncbi:hypothetical protein FPQ18DRAFT_381730 [Pyronema domesticum]|nr:hypothetical protein FPQ18DRAFT_381730 [Pyronema domesticum]
MPAKMEDLTIKFLLVFITYVSVVIVKNISFALYIIWDIRDGCNWHAKWNTVDFCSKYCERANPLIITTLAISSLAAYMTGAMDLGYDIACMLLILWNVGETVFCTSFAIITGNIKDYKELWGGAVEVRMGYGIFTLGSI